MNTSTETLHRTSWFVYTGRGRERIPVTATMRGRWPHGYDAVCSCGWETRTGGAVRSYVRAEVRMHKTIESL